MGDEIQSNSIDIEVGAVDGDLRYWKAKEALRQSELRLTSQGLMRTAFETRASAMVGWSTTGLLAVLAAGFSSQETAAQIAAGVSGICFFSTALLCLASIRPRYWITPGISPEDVQGMKFSSELEMIESMVAGIGAGIIKNDERLSRTTNLIRWAGRLMIAAPVTGAATFVLGRQIIAACWRIT